MRRLDQIPLAPHDRAAVEEAAGLLRERFPVEEVILFGSKARGEDDPESDIDLLVLTSRPLRHAERDALRDALAPTKRRHDVFLSLLIVDAREWREGLTSVLPIHREVEEQGVAA